MLQKSQFNIFDLQGFRRTQESLDRLLMRKDYRLGEPTLSERMANPKQSDAKRKESMLAKACADLKIDNIIFEFKSINPALDKIALEAFNEQKQLLDMQLALKVYRTISLQLEKEAAAIFAYEEKMKEYREAIREFLKQEESEAQLRKLGTQADSKREIEEALFKMRQEIHEKTMKHLDDIFEQVSKLSDRYNEIQDLRVRNKKRHNDNIQNTLNNYEINGQKVFTPEQQTEITGLLNQRNDVVNRIESLDQEAATLESNLSADTTSLAKVRTEISDLETSIVEQRKQFNAEENQDLDEYVRHLEDEAASELQVHLCKEQINNIHEERNRIRSTISVPTSDVDRKNIQEPVAPEISEALQERLHKLDKKEDYLNKKINELNEHRAYLARKKQEKESKLAKIGKNDITNPTYFINFSKLTLLRNEERELEKRIERTHQRLTEVKTERSLLSEKLHVITQSLDHAFNRTVDFIKRTFGRNEGGKVKDLQAKVEKEAETSRQEDNAMAAEAASCEQQMHNLFKQAEATVAVGASCGIQLGTAAPHSQHAAAVAGFQATESAKCAQIKATVAAALGAELGATTNLRANA